MSTMTFFAFSESVAHSSVGKSQSLRIVISARRIRYFSCTAWRSLKFASQFSEFEDHAVELECPPAPPDVASRMLECSKIRDHFAIKQMPWRGFIADSVKQYFELET